MQGHVDTVATILSKTPDGNALTVRLQPREKEVMVYIVEKGYITLDGASLTITQVDDVEGWFEVMLVAYTQEKIVIPGKSVGETVNVEVDMAGKYIEKQVQHHVERGLEGALRGLVGKLVEEEVRKQLAK